jgi:hypothetical protein
MVTLNLDLEQFSLFTETGAFQPLPESILDQMGDEQLAAYQQVHDSFDALFKIETQCRATERELHETVQELRACETRLEKFPKPSHTDLVREMIRTSRALG